METRFPNVCADDLVKERIILDNLPSDFISYADIVGAGVTVKHLHTKVKITYSSFIKKFVTVFLSPA